MHTGYTLFVSDILSVYENNHTQETLNNNALDQTDPNIAIV